jgi:hypothetical protein
MPNGMRDRVYQFFEYKWEKDKNLAFQSENDIAILDQLPWNAKMDIQFKFSNQMFFKKFNSWFRIKQKTSQGYRMYNMHDEVYRDFMTAIVGSLEPRYE